MYVISYTLRGMKLALCKSFRINILHCHVSDCMYFCNNCKSPLNLVNGT